MKTEEFTRISAWLMAIPERLPGFGFECTQIQKAADAIPLLQEFCASMRHVVAEVYGVDIERIPTVRIVDDTSDATLQRYERILINREGRSRELWISTNSLDKNAYALLSSSKKGWKLQLSPIQAYGITLTRMVVLSCGGNYKDIELVKGIYQHSVMRLDND